MSSAAAAPTGRSALDRGLPFPLADLGGGARGPAARLQPRRDHAAGRPAPRRRAGARRPDRRRPTPLGDRGPRRRRRRAARPAGARHRPGAAARPPHVVLAEGLADRRTWTSAPPGLDDVRRSRRRSGGRSGPSRSRACPSRPCAARRGCWPTPRRRAAGPGAYVLTGRGVEQSHAGHRHRHRGDQPRARCSACRAGSAPATARSPARATARAAASTARRPTSCPGYRIDRGPGRPCARRRRLGRRPGRPAADRDARRRSCCGSLGHARRSARAARARLATCWSAPPTPTACASGCASLDLLVVCDFLPSETALLADVVLPVTQWAEEEGTMTSLEGRVIRRRRALPPPPGVRSELEILADLAARLGSTGPLRHVAGRGLRRARAGVGAAAAPTTAASATRGSTPRRTCSGRSPPVRRRTPAPRGCSSTASRRPTVAPA